MDDVRMSQAFSLLHECLLDYIRSGQTHKAATLSRRMKEIHDNHAEANIKLLGLQRLAEDDDDDSQEDDTVMD